MKWSIIACCSRASRTKHQSEYNFVHFMYIKCMIKRVGNRIRSVACRRRPWRTFRPTAVYKIALFPQAFQIDACNGGNRRASPYPPASTPDWPMSAAALVRMSTVSFPAILQLRLEMPKGPTAVATCSSTWSSSGANRRDGPE